MNQGRSQGPHHNNSLKDLEIKSASHLALVEIVAGSVGHGFKIPFTGTLLSYYQLYICLGMMIRYKAAAVQVFNTTVIVALLKTLSPLGKKITPMIAIFMQGFFLWFCTTLLGGSIFGMLLGSILFVSWSIFQIAIGYTLVYGFDFFKMIEFFQKEMNDYTHLNIYWVFAAYWVLKIGLAIGLVAYLALKNSTEKEWTLEEKKLTAWRVKILMASNVGEGTSSSARALKDLVNPFFLISLIMMGLFHFYQGTAKMDIVWFVCRSLAVAFVLFYLIRSPWTKRALFSVFGKSRRCRALYKKMYLVKRRLEEPNRPSN
ncbi:MAG: hypothetical protein B7Y39_07105 [Bdellovibrio sp. 28-41-41]|nr:MAG: hypothetical protein B7Y39_07105 [Bdellovibrio sp. 28-41-41]